MSRISVISISSKGSGYTDQRLSVAVTQCVFISIPLFSPNGHVVPKPTVVNLDTIFGDTSMASHTGQKYNELKFTY